MNFDDVLPSFIAEGGELLRDMEAGLLECSRGNANAETINLIFRTAHTIKGSAGLFGLDNIVSFVHHIETALDRVRLGELALSESLVQLLLSCKDHTAALVASAAQSKNSPQPALQARSAELLAALEAATSATPPASGGSGTLGWHISLRFGPDVLTSGMDPLSFIRYLSSQGAITGLEVIADALPSLDELNPERCYLGFELVFVTNVGRERIEAAFEFVRDDCSLKLVPPRSPPSDYVDTLRGTGLNDTRIGEVLRLCGALTAPEIEEGMRPREVADVPASEAAPTAGPATGQTMGKAASGIAAAAGGPVSSAPSGLENQTVRVDASKLDTLITRIGELIIAAAGSQLLARRAGNAELEESVSTLASLVEQVRGGALQLRMVKIGGTFNRFQRVVHDVSRELGKEIELIVSGEDTELDKTVVERIADPLTHLVRNAIDHGIE